MYTTFSEGNKSLIVAKVSVFFYIPRFVREIFKIEEFDVNLEQGGSFFLDSRILSPPFP